tara:strand:- start:1949 stop:3373 length:1425 start_codon:yes stop_codon:yes gene_type:complete
MLDEKYRKVFRTIKSCETLEQLNGAVNIANNYFKSNNIKKSDPEYVSLSAALSIANAKCKDMIEEYFASTQDFENAAREGGLNIAFSEGFDKEKELEEGAKLMESFFKNKVDDRVEIARDLQKVIDVIKSIDSLEQKEVAQNLINQFHKNYKGFKQVDTLVASLQSQIDDVLREDVEEIDEATGGGASSGAFVGPMSGKPIKRTIYKSNVPVANAGGMATPIGKLYSFKKSQLKEANVVTKQQIVDESMDMGSIPTYDSPAGWGNNEFMGTKGKKGNAVQRKTKGNQKYKNTYDFDNGNGGSTFVTVKEKCKKFPYCSQGPGAIKLSKTPPSENTIVEKEEIEEMKLPSRNDIKEGWKKFVEVAKREGKETTMAAKIIKKILVSEDVSEKELKFVKEQSGDILKIFGVVTMGAISTALPILVEKMLNKKGLSILPKENSSTLDGDDNDEQLVETISKKTGKSKNYVHSLIKRYL